MAKLTQQELEAHLWGAANILRGKTAGQDYKTYILSLMFFKRLSDQWDCEAEETVDRLQEQSGMNLNDAQRKTLLVSAHVHQFKIPDGCYWLDVLGVAENIGAMSNAAMRGGPDPRDPENKRQLVGIAPATRQMKELEALVAQVNKAKDEPQRLGLTAPGEYPLFTVIRSMATNGDEAAWVQAAKTLMAELRRGQHLPEGWAAQPVVGRRSASRCKYRHGCPASTPWDCALKAKRSRLSWRRRSKNWHGQPRDYGERHR